jgi:hypothetical protein
MKTTTGETDQIETLRRFIVDAVLANMRWRRVSEYRDRSDVAFDVAGEVIRQLAIAGIEVISR